MDNRKPVSYFAVRKGRRLAINTQEQAAIAAGYDPDRFIDLDKDGLDSLIGSSGKPGALRRGNKLGVYRYEFLAPLGSGRGDRIPRAELKKITFRLMELGVIVEEIESGMSCKDENGALKMYANAIDRLAGSRKHDSPGRPVEHVYSDDECQLIEATWNRKDLNNPKARAAAVAALPGPDGKPRFPKFKQSTWYTLRSAGRVK